MAAYGRRKRWEADLQAMAFGKVVAVLFGGSAESEKEPDRVPAHVLLASLGMKVE